MSTRRLSSGILLVLAMTAGWGVPAGPLEAQAAAPTVLYLVRHAEVAPDGSPDPSLSAEGRARAARLAEMLRGAGLDAIHTTDYRRTRETAGAVANVTGLPLERYDPRALASLAERLRAAGGTYLVVGHSNTTPALVELLGGDAGPPIPEDEFGRIYKVSVEDGRVTTAVFEYTDGAVAVSSSLAAAPARQKCWTASPVPPSTR